MLEARRIFGKAWCGIAVLLFAGCAPRPDFIEKGLDPDSAFAKGIVVGGVALVEHNAAELKYARFLERSLKDQEHYKVAGVSLVSKRLGKEEYAGLMKGYRNERALDKEMLQKLAGLLDGYKYIVFVHFEKSDVDSSEGSETIRDDKGKETGTKTIKSATRTAKVHLEVYDLGSGNPVIKDGQEVTVENSNEYEDNTHEHLDDYIIDSILLGGDKDRVAPNPPSYDKLVKSGLTRVYRILAKERCFSLLC
jgi:hypothetical protein